MSDRNAWRRKRTTERVAVRLWVRLHGSTGDLQCSTIDLSDTGARLRLMLRDLTLPGDAGLFDVSRLVTKVFGEGCTGEFRHPRGTAWIAKELCLVRIGLLRRQAGDFEIGCRFREPLSDEDWRVLGFERAAVENPTA